MRSLPIEIQRLTCENLCYPRCMSQELIAIIGAAIALAAVILPGQWAMRRDIGELRERMARLEGLFEGFMQSSQETKSARSSGA